MSGRALFITALVGALLGSAMLWNDHDSTEWANRAFRSGDTLAAIEVYRAGAADTSAGAGLFYNLGTSLVTIDPEEAGPALRQAIDGGDPSVQQAGHYNLGYGFLRGVVPDLPADSAVALLEGAVASNRMALLLDLTDQDARWNLALSQRLLDSISLSGSYDERPEPTGRDETRVEDMARTRSPLGEGESGREPDEARASQQIGLRSGGAVGAQEAWAMQDPGPLSDTDALRLLEQMIDRPEDLVRGLLWAHRPELEWWSTQEYPGGNW